MHGNHITSCDYPSGLQNLIMMTNETDLLCSILHFATVLLCLHFISLTLWTFCAWNVFRCGASALDRLIIIIINRPKQDLLAILSHYDKQKALAVLPLKAK